MLSIFIAFFSIVVLAALHELGHFFIAKKCGVKVEEFGMGYPPRIFGKKIGETVYSLNALPFGAFVKMEGEDNENDSDTSFYKQSIRNKILITLGGVISFWVIAIIIFSVISYAGFESAVEDSDNSNLKDLKVRIVNVVKSSPAEDAGLQIGDTIKEMSFNEEVVTPRKISEVQLFTKEHYGDTVNLIVGRGNKNIAKPLTIRSSFPANQGAMGVSLIRTAVKKYTWYSSITQGVTRTWDGTIMVLDGYKTIALKALKGNSPEKGLIGPIGVIQIVANSQEFGTAYFLSFIALISINLAVFNSLPIPLVDGGRVFFLVIEWIRKKPISQKIQEKIDFTGLTFLVSLLVWVMIKDIINLF